MFWCVCVCVCVCAHVSHITCSSVIMCLHQFFITPLHAPHPHTPTHKHNICLYINTSFVTHAYLLAEI